MSRCTADNGNPRDTYPVTTRRTSAALPNPHRACWYPNAHSGGTAGEPVSPAQPCATRAGVPTNTQQRNGPPSSRSSLVPGRSAPDPAPSCPSRSSTRPSHVLSWNARCVPASATTHCTGMVMYSGSSPGPNPPFGSVFHSRYDPSRSRGPPARPPSPKNRASAGTSARTSHRAPPPPPGAPSTGSHQRGGNSRRNTVPPGVRTSTAPSRDTATVTRSDTTRQPPPVSGSNTARGSGSGPPPTTACDGDGSAPSQPQNTAPPTVTRTSSSDRANRSTPPPGRGSVPVSTPGTRARSAPRRASPTASARR